ncbi:RNA polymerase-binding transcription factor DksA [Roseovarius sp. MBR-154]|jgi:RNA polymerase-binding transcription factor DksA
MLDISTYREALMQRLKVLDGRLHAIETELDAPKSRDWEELAVEREGDEVLERLGRSGEDEIVRIRAALGRLRDGTYGICASCGEQISADRLDVLPETPLCRACAAQMS